jgi:hypothetical protein
MHVMRALFALLILTLAAPAALAQDARPAPDPDPAVITAAREALARGLRGQPTGQNLPKGQPLRETIDDRRPSLDRGTCFGKRPDRPC